MITAETLRSATWFYNSVTEGFTGTELQWFNLNTCWEEKPKPWHLFKFDAVLSPLLRLLNYDRLTRFFPSDRSWASLFSHVFKSRGCGQNFACNWWNALCSVSTVNTQRKHRVTALACQFSRSNSSSQTVGSGASHWNTWKYSGGEREPELWWE